MWLLVIAIALMAFAAQWYLLNYGLEGVHFSQCASCTLVEPEQPFTMHTTLENQKRYLPVLLQVQERLPEDAVMIGREQKSRLSLYRVQYYEYSQYLRCSSKTVRSYQAVLPARGRYAFQGAVLKGNDFFGTQESTRAVDDITEVVVMPKRLESIALDGLLGGFLGDVSVRRFIMEDPTLHTGFRGYTGREPLRAISWSQSVKGQGIMVKQYDHTSEPAVTILLSVEGGNQEEIEVCYSIVRTLCETLEKKGVRYDFFTNALMVGAPRACRHTGEGLGKQHFNTIAEGLGRARYSSVEPLRTTLRHAAKRVGDGSTLVVLPVRDASADVNLQWFLAQTGGVLRVITPQEVQV